MKHIYLVLKKYRLFMRKRRLLFLLIPVLAFLGACSSGTGQRLIIWTDSPEFALYSEYFNASQGKYKAEVRFYESPAQKLTEPGDYPDIVAASWLKNALTRSTFRTLDSLFSGDGPKRSSFYQNLLSLGEIDNHLYLLPVSFNIPVMIFARDYNHALLNPFTIEMEEIKERSITFNATSGSVFTRMGFSPLSNDEFLFITTVIFGAGFREAAPLAWDPMAIEQAVSWIQTWISEVNTGIQTEDDFVFKYFYDPPDKLVNSGRVLYVYMDSSSFFTLPEERKANLDFRWFASNENIPLGEKTVYFGIHRKAKAVKAAKAFAKWLFNAETQKLLLEALKEKGLNDMSFGLSGGFSSMKTVTEQIFPLYYPGLLGHMPPENSLSVPNALPRNWMIIKERIILPYLRERIRSPNRDAVRPLERRLNDWYRLNR